MTSPPVYSTALQQALSLLPHISPPEMKVLISAAKAQWAPRFSNEILADSFRYLSRKTLTEKICPVNSRYFQICVNSVPNVHNISKISVDSPNEAILRYDRPEQNSATLYLAVAYNYCYDTEKGRYSDAEHEVALEDFPRSAPFLHFDIVSIRTHFSASRICEFFRRHRGSFSHCKLLKMEDSCFESKNVLAESDVQMCGLLADVFKNCKNVKLSSHDYLGRPTTSDIFQDSEKLSGDDESSQNKWMGNTVAYLAHYLFNTPNAFLTVNIPHESLAVLLLEKVGEVFKNMTMETEFCVSFIYKPDKLRLPDNETLIIKNETSKQRLLFFKCSNLNERYKWINRDDKSIEEFRLWCAKVKPDEVLSCVNGYYDHWDHRL